ncbi:MAG TPA: 30S ribosomal protein S12 methylthiotransferase RimO [Gemmatimonadaceae bacterium]|nr:30S ribosomal protein S12 methylthiotransferase RimO [Gemmatimonadaceae bacterium]
MPSPPIRVALITLGCDKNTVDSERYLAQLAGHGAEPTEDLARAELIIVNTCGFIDAAKKESLDAILGAAQLKSEGVCRAVVAVGCMVQRHREELAAELPEVDLFLGAAEMDRLIPELTERGLLGEPIDLLPGERTYIGELPHLRYLKISEGCDHGCAFCAIPLMRGRHRTFALPDVVREAQLLELQGAREINLVAQDLAHYGRDRRDGVGLHQLLESLLAETSVPWFRLLYIYSAGLTPAVLELMARQPRIVPYLDMPIQHASDPVLRRMRRPERERTIRETVARVRAAVPDVALRTTCIVGFPGETDEDFERLLGFLEEVPFERVGAFTYSAQEGTLAGAMPDDVPEPLKRERLERLTELQRSITAERYERHIGRTVRAMIDHRADDDGIAVARTVWQADDIDGVTRLHGDGPPGAIVEVAIEDVVDDYDFRATLIRVVDQPPPVPARRRLPLPVAGASIGSFGR